MCQEPFPIDPILKRVSAGDSRAVQECIDRFGGLVWSLARRFIYSEAEAQDAVQEIFVEIWKSAGRYDPAVASEATFVSMIARRRLIDRRRSAKRRLDHEPLPETLPPAPQENENRADVTEEARRALDAIKNLSPEQQRVLRLSICQGLSHEKIAAATGMPMGTVKTHARRGLIELRSLLGASTAGRAGEGYR